MKITRIELSAFKAFARPEVFDLAGKHVLLFGENGSGKSSLYYALYYALRGEEDFMQQEDKDELLSAESPEEVRNHFADATLPSEITLSFDNEAQYYFGTNEAIINTPQMRQIIVDAQASMEMMSYKLLYSFYAFRPDDDNDLYEIFADEFFPFWKNSVYGNFENWELKIFGDIRQTRQTIPKPRKTSQTFKDLEAVISDFSVEVAKKVYELAIPANEWYQRLTDHKDKDLRIAFEVYKGELLGDFTWKYPIISLCLWVGDKYKKRPHAYLNEARLSMFALAIRLASFELRLAKSALKVLVLDDLLLSLDMSNRMKVFEVFLFSPKFKDFQKFIFTHDKGLYDVLKKNIVLHASAGKDWKFIEMFENPDKTLNPIQKDDKNNLSKAVEYYEAKDFEASALYLRKRVEELLRVYYDAELLSLSRLKVLDTLGNALQESNLKKEVQHKLMDSLEKVLTSGNLEADIITRLFDNNPPQDTSALGKYNKLKNELKAWLETYTKQKAQQEKETQELLKTAKMLDEIRARMLNAGAHYTDTPLFDWEVRGAIEKVKDFEKAVLGV